MKFFILGDTHFGARGASKHFSDYFGRFFTEVFFPYLKKHDIKIGFQLGDLFDVRKATNSYALEEAKANFFDVINDEEIDLHVLIGNHDAFYKETIVVNTPELVLGEYPTIGMYSSIKTVHLDDTSIDLIPWICEDNREESLDLIKNSKSDLCLGHFEIDGFEMYRGMPSHSDLKASDFSHYEKVLSGHFHTRSQVGNITYVGTPYEITWQDMNDIRGFHVFDTETRQLEFIENPLTIHERIEYDENELFHYKALDYSQYEGKYVRVIVKNKTDNIKFDQFISKLETFAISITIIEDLSAFKTGTVTDDVDLEDTLTLMDKYIDSVQTDVDRAKVKEYLKTLYLEAINMES